MPELLSRRSLGLRPDCQALKTRKRAATAGRYHQLSPCQAPGGCVGLRRPFPAPVRSVAPRRLGQLVASDERRCRDVTCAVQLDEVTT